MDDADAIRDLHAAFFAHLTEEAAPRLRSADEQVWLERLERDLANLRAALIWSEARASGDTHEAAAWAERGLRLATALRWFWYVRGRMNEGREWIQRMLVLPRAPGRGLEQARALSAAGFSPSTRVTRQGLGAG